MATNNEQIILVGSVGARPLVAKVNTEGKTIADYLLREQGMIALNSVIESGGNTVVVGEQGTFPDAAVWVGRVSPHGDVLAKTSFPGRPTDIARGTDGSYLVIIERGSANGSEIFMKALEPEFSERWTRLLMSRQLLSPSFQVASVATGGFIIVGTKDRGLWISRVKPDGTEAWTEAHEPLKSPEMEMVSHVELSTMQDIFVVAYTAFVVVGREQRQVVRIIRFRAN